MLSLDTLPEDVLREIATELDDVKLDQHCRTAFLFRSPSKDVFSLGSCTKSLRQALMPVMFKCLRLGRHEEEEKNSYVGELGDIASSSIVEYVSHLRVLDVQVEAVVPLAETIAKMSNLRAYQHSMAVPILTVVAKELSRLEGLVRIEFDQYGLESLPSVSLSSPLTLLDIDCEAIRPLIPKLLPHAPCAVAVARRQRAGGVLVALPTKHEQNAAVIQILAPILHMSSNHIRDLYIKHMPKATTLDELLDELRRLNKSREVNFPWLERIYFNCGDLDHHPAMGNSPAYQHLLRTSPNLTHIDIMHGGGSLRSPPVKLRYLRMLHILAEENVDLASGVKGYLRGGCLTNMVVNGLDAYLISSLFDSAFQGACIRKAKLLFMSHPFTSRHLQLILDAMPALEDLCIFSGFWHSHMTQILPVLYRHGQNLTSLSFDHPWERPGPTPLLYESDGSTIRTIKHGHFAFVSTRGNTVQQEIASRIRADVKAATKLYRTRFTEMATKCPKLETVVWNATDEVCWTWTFDRSSTVDLKVSQSAKVTVG